MRALVCHALSADFSGVELADVAAPQPGPGQALIRVRAASVNFPDLLMCQGLYQFKPEPPFIPGIDLAGEIAAFGPGPRRDFVVGEPVAGGVRLGAFAEFAVADLTALERKPERLSYAQAAAYPAAYLTAYVALIRRARIEAGETLLVLGAAGGVGLAAVDLGRHLGTRVIAAASSEDKRAFLRSYGAHEVIATEGLREAVRGLTDGRGADVVFDPVGGDAFDEALRVTAFDGRYLVVGFASGRIGRVDANIPLIKGISLVGVRAGEYGRRFAERGAENRAAVRALAESGAIRPHVHACLPLAQAKAAMAMLADRQAIGKVIVTCD